MTTGGRRQMAVRTPDPRLQRRRQLTAAAAIGAVVVGVLLLGVLLLGGGAGPRPTPSSIAQASARTSPTVFASQSAVATSSAIRPSPTASALSSVLPSAIVSLTPTPAGSPLGGNARDATFSQLGIDDKSAPEGIPRRITFNVDGGSDISVDISDITAGTVRLCLYQSDGSTDPTDADCTITDGGNLTRTATAADPWTVWLFGDEPGQSPAATVRIRWAASTAALQLADFRFQGTDSPDYTGFRVRVIPSAAGQLALNATWDDGQGGDYPYVITLTDLDGSGEPPIFQGSADHAEAVTNVVAGHHYEAAIDNTQETVLVQVLLRATVSWP